MKFKKFLQMNLSEGVYKYSEDSVDGLKMLLEENYKNIKTADSSELSEIKQEIKNIKKAIKLKKN